MKKFLLVLVVAVWIGSLVSGGVLAQDCFTCQDNDGSLGYITKFEVTEWDEQERPSAVDLYLSLLPGWNGKDENGCCTIWQDVVTQACVEFGVWRVYFGSDITGWGWDANHDRKTDKSEWMPYSKTYWAEWNLGPDKEDLYIIIHGIPLDDGVLRGNIFIVTHHGEIIYFVPSELKRCDQYARDDSHGAGEIYINFWST